MNYLVCDIDGVLSDFEGALVALLEHVFGADGRVNRHLFGLKERYGHDYGMLQTALEITSSPQTYKYLSQDKAAVKFLRDAYYYGFDILILTSRDRSLEDVTKTWLNRVLHGIQFELDFSLNKAASLFSVREHVGFVVEDNPEEITEMQKLGIPVFAWEQPWNCEIFPKLIPDRELNIMVQVNEEEDWVPFFEYFTKEMK